MKATINAARVYISWRLKELRFLEEAMVLLEADKSAQDHERKALAFVYCNKVANDAFEEWRKEVLRSGESVVVETEHKED